MLDDVIFEVIEGAVVDVLFDPSVACGMPDKDEVAFRVKVVVLVVFALHVVVTLFVDVAVLVGLVLLVLLVMVVSAAVAVVILRGVDVVRGGGGGGGAALKYLVLTGFSLSLPSSCSSSLSR